MVVPPFNNLKRIDKTIYKYVSKYKDIKTGNIWFCASVPKNLTGFKMSYYFCTLKEAAICVDKYLINKGKEPVNILKRKCK